MIPCCIVVPVETPETLRSGVTAAEWDAAAKFMPHRQAEFLTWRALIRRELGPVSISYTETGAPRLDDSPLFIGVSHCRGYVAVVIGDHPCAVDIEPVDRNFSRAAVRYLDPSEAALSLDPRLAGVVWCAKETLYKYAGEPGLDLLRDLRIVHVDLEGGTLTGRIRDGEPLTLHLEFRDGLIVVYLL